MTAAPADWWTAGCYEVAPGVHRIPLAMPHDALRAVNVYLVETSDGPVLIDGGWHLPAAIDDLKTALRSIGHAIEGLRSILVTHIHRDHYTLAVELRRRSGTHIFLGRAEAPGLLAVRQLNSNVPVSTLHELDRAGASDLTSQVVTLTQDQPFDAADWEDPDGWLDEGPLDLGSRCLEVVSTPGHTKGHVIFHDVDAGLMFTGDHVLPTITPSIGFELGERGRPLADYLDSLTLMLSRPDALAMPAHGHPGGSVHDRVSVLLTHHEDRLDEIQHIMRRADGPRTGVHVASELRWTRHRRSFATLDAFNQMIAVSETMAHLDLLAERGDLRSFPDKDPLITLFAR